MRICLFISFFFFYWYAAPAQKSGTWNMFWNVDTTLMGFKDSGGNVRIEPKFRGLTAATKFDNIVGVTEELPDTFYHYYLTRSGRIVGQDSLLNIDNMADCENEGFIRFIDKNTDKIGMFNGNGYVVIPAMYSWLSKARNGMVVALKGARKVWLDEEHWAMEGGRTVLIDTNNKLLADSFIFDDRINFYSLVISEQPHPDSIRQNFRAFDGTYLSFVDYEKEFNQWANANLAATLTESGLSGIAFEKITYWHKWKGWVQEPEMKLIKKNFTAIKKQLARSKQPGGSYATFQYHLNPLIFESAKYDLYFDNCREPKEWKYPIFSVYEHTKDMGQFTLDFLRTKDGYKLISLRLRKIK